MLISRPSQVHVSFRTDELFETIRSANGTDRTVLLSELNFSNSSFWTNWSSRTVLLNELNFSNSSFWTNWTSRTVLLNELNFSNSSFWMNWTSRTVLLNELNFSNSSFWMNWTSRTVLLNELNTDCGRHAIWFQIWKSIMWVHRTPQTPYIRTMYEFQRSIHDGYLYTSMSIHRRFWKRKLIWIFVGY